MTMAAIQTPATAPTLLIPIRRKSGIWRNLVVDEGVYEDFKRSVLRVVQMDVCQRCRLPLARRVDELLDSFTLAWCSDACLNR